MGLQLTHLAAFASARLGRIPRRSGWRWLATSLAASFVVTIAASAAAGAAPVVWPDDAPARAADSAGALGTNISGLAVAGTSELWAVRDAPGALLALDRVGETWIARAGWGAGRALRYPDGQVGPDAEAVTIAATDPGAVYVGAERDNDESSRRRNSVLRYDTSGAGALTATAEWRLDDVLPDDGANAGIEGIAWIADEVLVAAGLVQVDGARYVPSAHPAHRGGAFVVASERQGDLYVVALTDDGGVTLIATVASGLPAVMELHWDTEHAELWAACDDTCEGRSAVLRPLDGSFAVVAVVAPPSGSASLNDEGFARMPCRDGRSLVVWADDQATGGHVLRESALSCTPFADLLRTTEPPGAADGPAAYGRSDDDGIARRVAAAVILVAGSAGGFAIVRHRRRRP